MQKLSFFKKMDNDELDEYLIAREERRKIRAEHRIVRKTNKNEEKARINGIKKKQRWFHFFSKWFFLGIILVCISVCISLSIEKINSNSLEILLTFLSAFFSTIGVSLFVGSIFDFSKNSEAFIAAVSKILSDIVVSKKFLSSLSVKDKEQALNLILRPEVAQIEQYANINEFFKKRIKEAMTMFDANFKTNVTLNVEAHKDVQNNLVYCEGTLTYTVYKLNDKFEPLVVVFEKEGSSSEKVKIISPNGELKTGEEKETEEIIGGIKCKRVVLTIPEEGEKYDHLTVKRIFKEPGKDHWINYIWKSLTPYEGVTCHIKCYDGLTIKDFMIFDNKVYYHVDKSEDNTKIDITSSQWLDPDTGFAFVISE